jgi:hypothetical protein
MSTAAKSPEADRAPLGQDFVNNDGVCEEDCGACPRSDPLPRREHTGHQVGADRVDQLRYSRAYPLWLDDISPMMRKEPLMPGDIPHRYRTAPVLTCLGSQAIFFCGGNCSFAADSSGSKDRSWVDAT